MLGKIFTVCLLVSVSACLVRPSTASKPKLAGVADDVAALLSKLGAKSTDEAVAKLWAKGDELSDEDVVDMVKLLKSSDGAAVLAALQRPVTSKLAKLDNMLAEYKLNTAPAKFRQAMLADMDKTVDEINAAVARYEKILSQIRMQHQHYVSKLGYPARQVLEMAKIQGLAPLKHITLVGTADEVVEANLLIRNFDNLEQFVRLNVRKIAPDDLPAFKKMLEKGDLEDEIYPLYNSLLKFNEESYMQSISKDVSDIINSNTNSMQRRLDYVNKNLDRIKEGLFCRRELLERSGISAARKAEIEKGSLYFIKGSDNKTIADFGGMSGWAKETRALLDKHFANLKNKVSFNREIVITKPTIDKTLKEIEQMP